MADLSGATSSTSVNWGGYAQLLGSAISGVAAITGGKHSAKRNYKYTLALQNAQNDFTRYMSNTAHQREVADLRAAGLNPILSATGGAGASTPSAGSATFDGFDDLAAINSAIQNNQKWQEIKNDSKRLENETDLKETQVENLTKDNAVKEATKEYIEAQKAYQELQTELYPSQVSAGNYSLMKNADTASRNADYNSRAKSLYEVLDKYLGPLLTPESKGGKARVNEPGFLLKEVRANLPNRNTSRR